ncbi:hypothetical protein P4476_14415 [Ureibacillus terrenus]|uniref:hypothetical protein n=1 Tax=Ureibacillus terrenus TaxID=118246 RepID=UPI002E1C2E06|nr:hypothetical protein [Ureibacillus terrenus]
MKFKVFKLQELIYKKIVYMVVFIITVACIVLYLLNRTSDEISYILSIFYALFLFIVGLYMNNMSIHTQNMFYKRKGQYRSLKELSEIYKPTTNEKEDLFSFILMVQALTGRTSTDMKSFITFNGFEYTEKYLKLENSFLEQRKELISLLNDEIKNYISSHKLKKKVVNVFVHDMTKFFDDINGWVDETLDLATEEKTEFIRFIKGFCKKHKRKLKKFDKTTHKIRKMIDKTSKKCRNNMAKIEEVYGDLLFESLNEENELSTNFAVLERLIHELKKEVLVETDFEEITGEYFERIQEYLRNIDIKLQSVIEEVEEIRINTYSDF